MANGDYKQVIKQFREKVEQRSLAVIQDTAGEMADRVIHRTPVDRGEARGNWLAAINTIDQEHDKNSLDPSGDARAARAREIARQMKLGDVFTLANSTPYIFPLEFEAHSQQAPFGFVGVTVAEFPLIVRDSAERAARGRA